MDALSISEAARGEPEQLHWIEKAYFECKRQGTSHKRENFRLLHVQGKLRDF